MKRICEPEYMDTPAEADAYDRMDHAQVNAQFVADLLWEWRSAAEGARVLDLGTGTALIPIELCRHVLRPRVVAVDAAANMLRLAEENIARAKLTERIATIEIDIKALPDELREFDVVMSNSLVHHMPEPRAFFAAAVEAMASGGLLFVRDLVRPAQVAELTQLVETHARDADPGQRKLFADSLRAALTLEEVRELVAEQGFAPASARQTSDRHWTWVGRRGANSGA